MKINKQRISYFLLLLFFLYGLDNHIFERSFYFNEILSIVGIYLFIYNTYKSNKLIIPKSRIYRCILAILALGMLHLLVSTFLKTNWYFYFRNSVIVYSIFTFFLGFYLYPYLLSFIKTIRPFLWVYVVYALIFPSLAVMERFMGAVFFPFLFKKHNFKAISAIVVLSFILANRYESLTVIIVTLFVLFIYLLPSFKLFKISFAISLVGIIACFFYLKPQLEKYVDPPYSLTGNITAVASESEILKLDGNSTWRAVYWYRLIVERFPENLIGIGFGTPLLDYIKGMDTIPVANDDMHDAHVSGAHNTYLTLTTRLGVLFLLFLGLILNQVFKHYYLFRKTKVDSQFLLIYYSFFTVFAIGLFNLVLESPTGASLFWGLLGFVAANIEEQRTHIHGS